MTKRFKLPQLLELIKDWKVLGCLFFYKKNLHEFRNPQLHLNTKVAENQPVKQSLLSVVYSLFNKLKQFFGFFWFALICFFVPKNRTLFFNHSQRKRISKEGVRPLYLASHSFNLSNMIIFESEANEFKYPKGVVRLDVNAVLGFTSIVSFLLNQIYFLIFGVKDRDVVDFVTKFHIWSLLLSVIKPKNVALLVWYGKEPLIAACKKLEIEVLELQHGIIYEEHPFYNILDGVKIQNSEHLLPDQCLVYGEYWRNNLIKSGWDPKNISIIGYFLDISSSRPRRASEPYIVYSSSPYVKDAVIQHIRSIEAEVERRNWKILISVHPVDKSEDYEEVLSKNVTITELDAYDALRDCVALISVSSTLLWEAMVFDKPAFIIEYGFEATGLLDDLISYGYGKVLANGEFPEPFELPHTPNKEFFFSSDIDTSILSA